MNQIISVTLHQGKAICVVENGDVWQFSIEFRYLPHIKHVATLVGPPEKYPQQLKAVVDYLKAEQSQP